MKKTEFWKPPSASVDQCEHCDAVLNDGRMEADESLPGHTTRLIAVQILLGNCWAPFRDKLMGLKAILYDCRHCHVEDLQVGCWGIGQRKQ